MKKDFKANTDKNLVEPLELHNEKVEEALAEIEKFLSELPGQDYYLVSELRRPLSDRFVDLLTVLLYYCFASGKPPGGLPHISPKSKAILGREFLSRAVGDIIADPKNMGIPMNARDIAEQLGFDIPEKLQTPPEDHLKTKESSESDENKDADVSERKKINRDINFAHIVCSYYGHKAAEGNPNITYIEGEGFTHDILIY